MRPDYLILAAAGEGRPEASIDNLTNNVEALGTFVGAICLATVVIHLGFRIAGYGPTAPLILLPLALPALVFSSWAALAIALSVCLATLSSAAWQRQDEERGGVEAQRARERPGLRALVFERKQTQLWREQRVRDDRFALGTNRAGGVVTVPFGAHQGVRALIPGAPGSGKTVDLAVHARAYVAAGQGACVIDPKGDRDLRAQAEAIAGEFGRRFSLWAPEGPATYNPLAEGNPSEITDKALSGEEWSEPHYLRQAQRYLNIELAVLRAAGQWPPTLKALVAHLYPERLEAVCDRLSERDAARAREYLDDLSPRARAELGGVRDRLAILDESHLGRYLRPADGAPQIKLKDALARGDVVYFQLDADRFALCSQMLGAAILSDLVSVTGSAQGAPIRALVLIDEFAAIAAEQVSRLLGRSRSAGLSVILAAQAFADFSVARAGDSSESLRRQVLSHIDYLVAHRQSEPEAAELLGQMAGTKPAWSVARSHTPKPFWERSAKDIFKGDSITRRRTREFVRHPDEFKRLRTGEAIVIEPTRKGVAELISVWGPDGEGLRYPRERASLFELAQGWRW